QEAIMQTRMQPIGTVFNKFPRIVRDMSHTLGKQCELTVQGKNVEMDKTIIEAIGDPLTHLIRNAVDHGIETPAARAGRGKNPVGNILLKAFHQAGKVNIAIEDDGAGIDPKRLKEKAVAKGILTPDQARQISDRETIRLIFHPGFSTAEKVTAVSGRGVGMDVVKTNIERLGGTVEVDTKVGSGTTIQIRLPLTLAIIPCLIVRSGANRYAIPQVNISELVRIRSDEITKRIDHIKNAQVLRLRGHLLPLVRLDDLLGQPADPSEPADAAGPPRRETDAVSSKTSSRAINVIVVESGHLRYGLIVKELFDSKEIVVKPLGRHLKECHSLAGATILGDGKVSLILDVAGIASYCKLVMPETDTVTEPSSGRVKQQEETQSVLIFTNHPDEYFGFPSEFIARIERIRKEQIDSVGGQEVLQYRGASLPLIRLEHRIKAQASPDKPDLYVIVFRVHQREIGLIVPDLIDIRELPMNLDTETFAESGVAGSLINEGKNIRLIDMYELVKIDMPSSPDASGAANAAVPGRHATILLVEDSTFFRQQMAHILQEDGLSVVACPDGLHAWQALQHPDQVVDLVVTDIEMPNMNGLELANKIKTDPCFAHLPVIAVSSLASDQDIRRGQEAGVDEYQIKMDREALLEAIHRHLEQSRRHAGLSAPSRQSPRGVSL
ncbi:MAG: chemotaxis protein CheW, partial [Sedimentisphaerales bacterium]|nr:chemotaxis protein CheW [Sedimentisphaerales bacterium]